MKYTKMVPYYEDKDGKLVYGEPIDVKLEIPDDYNLDDYFNGFESFEIIKKVGFKKYKVKNPEIEAIQFNGRNFEAIKELIGEKAILGEMYFGNKIVEFALKNTMTSRDVVEKGDYIVKGPIKDYYYIYDEKEFKTKFVEIKEESEKKE